MRRGRGWWMLVLGAAIVALGVANLLLGSVEIPFRAVVDILTGGDGSAFDAGAFGGGGSLHGGVSEVWRNIVLKTRLPQTLVALFAGAGLAVSGLLMQTVFRNPLAGPSVLGISSGASLGVACVVLASGLGGRALSRMGYFGDAALSLAAVTGALAVMALIAWVSQRVRGNVTLLIIGVMIGYVASAVIGVLKFFSADEDISAYVIWGLGSFSRVSGDRVTIFAVTMCVLLPLTFLLTKTLNLMLLGDGYARNLGLNVRRARLLTIVASGVPVAIVTAWCGPVMFLGLAVPHLCRGIFATSDHRVLIPSSMLCGAALALACNLVARLPGLDGMLPVNSVTALVGAPVVMWVLFRRRKSEFSE